jgi:hypothetical protein
MNELELLRAIADVGEEHERDTKEERTMTDDRDAAMPHGTVMTPAHPRWDEFCERLDETIEHRGCNGCGHPAAHEGARAILASMDMDVGESLAVFHARGGHCDCEILLNVAPHEAPEGRA